MFVEYTMVGVRSYWSQATQPLQSLVFVLPMLLAYEVGIVALGPQAVHNGADQWLRQALYAVGLGQYVLLPLLTCAILLGWHHLTHLPWKFSFRILVGMFVEAIAWAFVLLILFRIQSWLFSLFATQPPVLSLQENVASIVGYFGAGIYEELLFRLMLLPAAFFALRAIGLEKRACLVAAIAITSMLFAAAHYQIFTGTGDIFAWNSFIFRVMAGLFFSSLLVTRGFGIAAGAHAAYDILVFLRIF